MSHSMVIIPKTSTSSDLQGLRLKLSPKFQTSINDPILWVKKLTEPCHGGCLPPNAQRSTTTLGGRRSQPFVQVDFGFWMILGHLESSEVHLRQLGFLFYYPVSNWKIPGFVHDGCATSLSRRMFSPIEIGIQKLTANLTHLTRTKSTNLQKKIFSAFFF